MEEVIKYLATLSGAARDVAKCYIRSAPKQIDTAYRRRVEVTLHWDAHGAEHE